MAKFEVGEDVYTFANTPTKLKEWKARAVKARVEVENLPEGHKHIVFYMTDAYMRNYSANTTIPYKETVTSIRTDGWRKTKLHKITIRQGRIKTSNGEEIATLEMMQGFVRAADRELTPREVDKAEIVELQKKLDKFEAKEETPNKVESPKIEKDKVNASAGTKG